MSIVMEKVADYVKYAGIKRTERLMTSVAKKMLGGKKALNNRVNQPFPNLELGMATAAGGFGKRRPVDKKLVDAMHSSVGKLERRMGRYAPGEEEYQRRLFTQFRGYGHNDTTGRRLTKYMAENAGD
ncbi:MAG: hypothetical protein Q8M92_06625 [Candidatus Subteraquimicrobiales bacterium]|nr:hypothetical protein [Candidatus Subteraquimicrobiales bacterium]